MIPAAIVCGYVVIAAATVVWLKFTPAAEKADSTLADIGFDDAADQACALTIADADWEIACLEAQLAAPAYRRERS